MNKKLIEAIILFTTKYPEEIKFISVGNRFESDIYNIQTKTGDNYQVDLFDKNITKF